MLKVLKQMICLITIILLSVSLLVGCVANKTDKNVSSQVDVAGGNQTEKTYEPITMRKISYGVIVDDALKAQEYMIRKIKERFNVDLIIEGIDKNSYEEKMNVIWASGDLPDILMELSSERRKRAVENGMFVPIDDIYERNEDWQKIDPVYLEVGTFNGKLYAIPENYNIPESIYYRVDWANKLGLDAPRNADELFEMAVAFAKRDPDGNNKDDTYGLSMRGDLEMTNAYWGLFVPIVPGEFYIDDKDDTIKNSLLLVEDVKKGLTWFRRLYEEGALDPEWIVDKNTDVEEKFVTGKTGLWTKGAQWISSRYNRMKEAFPDVDITSIPTMQGTYGANYYTFVEGSNLSFITVKSKDIERAKKIYEYFLSPEGVYDAWLGEEGVVWKVENDQLVFLVEGAEKVYHPGSILSSIFKLKLPAPDPILERSVANTEGARVFKAVSNYLLESETYMDNYADIIKLRNEYFANIIMGNYEVDSYDQLVNECIDMGLNKMLEEANEAYKKMK